MNDWKDRLRVVYSTNPDYEYEYESTEEPDTLPPSEQKLMVSIDKKQRNGKKVVLIEGFVGTTEDLKTLTKSLKMYCGTGGSCKENTIIIQGGNRDKVVTYLTQKGYSVKTKGGY